MRLVEVYNIFEAGKIESELGFSPNIAKFLNKKAGKFAYAIANFIKNFIEEKGWDRYSQNMIYHFIDGDLFWSDQSNVAGPGEQLVNLLKRYPHYKEKFMKTKSLEDAFNVFPKQMPKARKENIVIKFSDGFFWYEIPADNRKEELGDEGRLMQHCGGGKNTYSLRDKNNIPHVTIVMSKQKLPHLNNEIHNIAGQIVGKQNSIPKKKYWSKIKEFVEKYDIRYAFDQHDEYNRLSPQAKFEFFNFVLKPEDVKAKYALKKENDETY